MVSLKNIGWYKNFNWDKFVQKKIISQKDSYYAKHFRIIMFSWLFSWFCRTINVYQCFFTLNILLDKVDRGLGHGKKNILIDTIYIV